MDLKTLNRIDTLRRLRSKGPQTPEWLKPHPLLLILLTIAILVLILFFN